MSAQLHALYLCLVCAVPPFSADSFKQLLFINKPSSLSVLTTEGFGALMARGRNI